MLTFFKEKDDNFTRWVAEKMDRMVVAHRIVEVDENTDLPHEVDRQKLPTLSDGHEQWENEESIKNFLEELHQDLQFSQSIQSDACYIDPENPDECL